MNRNEQLHQEILSIKERIKKLEEYLHDNVMNEEKEEKDTEQEQKT